MRKTEHLRFEISISEANLGHGCLVNYIQICHFQESLKSAELCLNWLSLLKLPHSWQTACKWLVESCPALNTFWNVSMRTCFFFFYILKCTSESFISSRGGASFFLTFTHTAVTTPGLITASPCLRWGTSADVWNGQATFSQQCDHRSCISQLPPRRFTLIILHWRRPTNSPQSISGWWTKGREQV